MLTADRIANANGKINSLIGKIDRHRALRDVMVAFQENPIQFLNDAIATQTHAFKVGAF